MRSARRRPWWLDVPLGVVIGLASWAAAEVASMPTRFDGGPWGRGPRGPGGGPDFAPTELSAALTLFLVLLVAGVAVRRLRSRTSFVVVVVATAGYLASGGPYGPVLLAPALGVHALATSLPFRRWAPLTLLLLPMMMAHYWDEPYRGVFDPTLYGALVSGFALMVVPAMFGLLHRNHRESEQLEREQELRRYAYEERLQIAREVHDVVGHSLSVINLQAGVALHVLDRRPDEVAASLEAIKRTSREALAELRTTLAVFRDPAADEPRAPRPGLARLDDLVAALRAAGREVVVQVDPGDAPLPAAVDQAAYRIVQEALTNVVRHAGTQPARLTISRTPGLVVIEVTDGGDPIPPGTLVEGNGILGMRERAGAVGGSLTVTPVPTGGLRVRAELPLAETTATTGEPVQVE